MRHGWADLALIQKELRSRREAAEQEARMQRERAAALERERRLFELSVGPVQQLAPHQQVHRAPPRPPPEPRQRQADDAQVLAQALSDHFDVDSLLETDAELSYRRPGIGPEVLNRLRRGEWSLQAQLDLHGLRRDEAREALGQFLQQCRLRGRRCVRVVHGKGHGSPGGEGILRLKVRRWLVQHDAVLAFVQARAAEGGAGALIVLLD
ncbi:DNA-nicking Smr family endonuclease [Inhella inkyongensis]|uniref:DNA-nicking Smr family endonuclease n=1 Tax=Inhella inkyongensis TaxID=392593 RepID=A0A840SC56_9BURK|nr:Smr/MutS family protein [Inhella inkyongensis]MBB5206041.1 DNA-nicking Smr family endonuclease [Inhella inkyongensis]